MNEPREADDRNDDAVQHAHDGSTFDADEGDPDGAAFAGDDTVTQADDKPRQHGYGYE